MSGRSPAAILYDASGNPLAVQDGVAVPANTPSLLLAGKDINGYARHVKALPDGSIRTTMRTLLQSIAEGHDPTRQAWVGHSKLTLSSSTGTGRQLLTYGSWPWQTSGAQRSIKSTSANDNGSGTGARKILIAYISSVDGTQKYEVITLAGLTAVNTVATDIQNINGMMVISSGTGMVAAGDITLYSTTGGGGVSIAALQPGGTTTHSSTYWVPSDKTLYVAELSFFFDSGAFIDLERTVDLTAFGGDAHQLDVFYHGFVDKNAGAHTSGFPLPEQVGPGQRFSFYVLDGGNGNTMAARAYGWLE